MKTYTERKEQARNLAIEWQADFVNHNYSWQGLSIAQEYFEKIGKRYGLLTEFRENGII